MFHAESIKSPEPTKPERIRFKQSSGVTFKTERPITLPGSSAKTQPKVREEATRNDRVRIRTPQNAAVWIKNPLSIFGDDTELKFHRNPVVELVIFMTKLQGKESLNIIRSRLLSVIFHKLKVEGLDVQRLRSANAGQLVEIALRSGISKDTNSLEHQVTEDQIRYWTNPGT